MGWFSKDKKPEEEIDPSLREYFEKATYEDAGKKAAAQALPRMANEQTSTISPTAPISQEVNAEGRMKTIKQVAMDNCVEYEVAYSKCLTGGSLASRMGGCLQQQTMVSKCQELQTNALAVLGYAKAQDAGEKSVIKARADDLMLKHVPKLIITDSMVKDFNDALKKL